MSSEKNLLIIKVRGSKAYCREGFRGSPWVHRGSLWLLGGPCRNIIIMLDLTIDVYNKLNPP